MCIINIHGIWIKFEDIAMFDVCNCLINHLTDYILGI